MPGSPRAASRRTALRSGSVGILDEDVARVREATDIVAVVSEHVGLQAGRSPLPGAVPLPRGEDAVVLGQPGARAVPLLRLRRRAATPSASSARSSTSTSPPPSSAWPAKAGHHAPLRRRRRQPGPPAPGPPRRSHGGRRRVLPPAPARRRRGRASPANTSAAAASTATSPGRSRSASPPTATTPCPSSSSEQKFSREDLVDAGLAFVNRVNKLQDFFRARVMFPIFDVRGDPVAFGGRALEGRPEVQELAGVADLPEEPGPLRPQLGQARHRGQARRP